MKVAAYGSTSIGEVVERLRSAGIDARYAGPTDAIVADEGTWIVAQVEGRVPAALQSASAAIAGRLLLFVDRATEETEPDLLAIPATLPALVVKQGVLGADDLALAVEKIVSPTPIGIERYVAGAPRTTVTLNVSSERGLALSKLQAFMQDLALDARRVAQIVTIADELITNAFYHAPVDGIGGHPHSHTSRMDPVEAKPGRAVELSYAKSASRVVVAVRDRYGSLAERQLRAHLARAATSPTASFKVSGGAGGARLGLVTALRAASQLIFDIVPGETAECIGVVETKGTYREFQEAGRALQLFQLRPSRG